MLSNDKTKMNTKNDHFVRTDKLHVDLGEQEKSLVQCFCSVPKGESCSY